LQDETEASNWNTKSSTINVVRNGNLTYQICNRSIFGCFDGDQLEPMSWNLTNPAQIITSGVLGFSNELAIFCCILEATIHSIVALSFDLQSSFVFAALNSPPTCLLAIEPGVLYVGTYDKYIYVLNESGDVIQKINVIEIGTPNAFFAHDSRILIGFRNGFYSWLDVPSNTLGPNYEIGNGPVTFKRGPNGTLFVHRDSKASILTWRNDHYQEKTLDIQCTCIAQFQEGILFAQNDKLKFGRIGQGLSMKKHKPQDKV
jgi:hypothetical protein